MSVAVNHTDIHAENSSEFPEHMPSGLRYSLPDTLTIITTYQCTAACSECCFECNPKVQGRLGLTEIKQYIDRAMADFPGLKLVVFSGGECFLLQQNLYAAVAHAHRRSLRTRCVTNGFWGKTQNTCREVVRQLVHAGMDEVNISTGHDHQEWVPVQSVIRAAKMLVENDIVTVVVVEIDAPGSECLQQLMEMADIRYLLQRPKLFHLQCNSWMPFHETSLARRALQDKSELLSGCKQLFHNVTLTPTGELAACCGLTLEHIPEMKLGKQSAMQPMADRYYGQLTDFLKIWIKVDGPYTIIRRLFGDAVQEDLQDVVHICQACAILHQHPEIRARIQQRYMEFMPEVMSRFYLQQSINSHQASLACNPVLNPPEKEGSI
ncbi:MAG TPA: radical SAM protein [Gammaproteobacteria bacterium]|jgi:MoaA/NifB/PqqE/SkfB family radical SAM enzyme|nr:radical SAM protein [Gammaproteobacteria bacterium]